MKRQIRVMVYIVFVLAVVGTWGHASESVSNTCRLTEHPVVDNGQEIIRTDLNALIGKVVLVISAARVDSPDRRYCIGTIFKVSDDGKWLYLQYNDSTWVKKLVKAYRKKIAAENKERRRAWKALKDKEGKELKSDWFSCKNKASFGMKDFTTVVDIPEALYEIYLLSPSEPMNLVYRGQPKNIYDQAHIDKKKLELEEILQSFVTYEVTGTASSVNVTYREHGTTNQENGVKLPWKHSFPAEAGEFLYISAQNQGRTGKIEVTIRKGDNVFKSAHGEGAFAIASASGTF